jgi:hypothetical protein
MPRVMHLLYTEALEEATQNVKVWKMFLRCDATLRGPNYKKKSRVSPLILIYYGSLNVRVVEIKCLEVGKK